MQSITIVEAFCMQWSRIKLGYARLGVMVVAVIAAGVSIYWNVNSHTCPQAYSTMPTTFCLSPSQKEAGLHTVHMSTLPDSFFLSLGEVLVSPPSGISASVTESRAESTALAMARKQYSEDNPVISEVKLEYVLDFDSNTTHGTLFWVINLTQHGGDFPITGTCPYGHPCNMSSPSRHAFLVGYVNATNGDTSVILDP